MVYNSVAILFLLWTTIFDANYTVEPTEGITLTLLSREKRQRSSTNIDLKASLSAFFCQDSSHITFKIIKKSANILTISKLTPPVLHIHHCTITITLLFFLFFNI